MILTLTEQGYTLDCPENEIWQHAFQADSWAFLYHLALDRTSIDAPDLHYLVSIGTRFVEDATQKPEIEFTRETTTFSLSDETVQRIVASRPFFRGDSYFTPDWVREAYASIASVFCREISSFAGTVERYFAQANPELKTANRMYFHLVEANGQSFPFAFLATYANAQAAHVPLSEALKEYKNDQATLLTLLAPLSKIAEQSPFIASLMESGELFKAVGLTSDEAYRFLREIPIYQEAGISCRIPDFWKRRKRQVQVRLVVGQKKQSMFGAASLLDCHPEILVDGQLFTREELEDLLSTTNGLRLVKGRWVDVDRERLGQLLASYDQLSRHNGFLTLNDVLRSQLGEPSKLPEDVEVENGVWLQQLLATLHNPAKGEAVPTVPSLFHGTLRPYQMEGFTYLYRMNRLSLGCCLADDMGLGKTPQILSLLTTIPGKILLVVPPSLVGNWIGEMHRFTPLLPPTLLVGSSKQVEEQDLGKDGVYLTTYSLLSRLKAVDAITWDVVVIDEAQMIKNTGSAQSKAVRRLSSRQRIALTGTPIENSLSDLYSIFDWLNPGMLGTKKEFTDLSKRMAKEQSYDRLRSVISPFILRRMKTDKTIIPDLPDKIIEQEYPLLTPLQERLYQQVVDHLAESLQEVDGIQRKGLVLSSIMALKQICNHPSQFSGGDLYDPKQSGKFQLLQQLCAGIAEAHERVLVFTQFRQIIPALDSLLSEVFGKQGLTLDGQTPATERTKRVEAFNATSYCPYMILSLKAGGVGLNLTAATQVIHFDRWWNPAVEEQATDRAFRIGQTNDVVVHTMTTKGTLEEKIAALLDEKRSLSQAILAASGEGWITNLDDQAILSLCALEDT
jgi:non-specific serine/threonine protein kinase